MLAPETRLEGRTHVRFEGRRLLYFAGGDYHGFSRDPALRRVAAATARRDGLSAAASRSTTGNHSLYLQLERTVARFFRTDAAAVFSGGYLGNAILARAADAPDVLALDAGAHVSLLDAARLLDKPIHRYAHFDADALADLLKQQTGKRVLIMTDSVGGMLGDLAPVPEIAALAERHGASVLLDEAHAFGVIGAGGRGSVEAWGLSPERLLRNGSFSKAFGAFGGLIPGDAGRIERLRSIPPFVGASSIPLPLVAAADAAVLRLEAEPERVRRLAARALRIKTALRDTGLCATCNEVPIIAIHLPREADQAESRRILLRRGLYPPHVRYPGLPPGGMYRFIVRSSNTDAEIDRLERALLAVAGAVAR